MAPTEYRVIAKRATLRALPTLRGMVAAGEALNPEVLRAGSEATGLEIRDGYGQTETGQLTGAPLGERRRPGSMGLAAARREPEIVDGELVLDPRIAADLLPRLPRRARAPRARGSWAVDDRRAARSVAHRRPGPRDEDGWLHFEGRGDDMIISAGYRIGPFEVESALVAHPAVAEAAAVAAPDEERGAVVRAVVVLRDPQRAGPPELVARAPGARQARDRALQVPADHRVRRRAAEDGQRQDPASCAAGAPERAPSGSGSASCGSECVGGRSTSIAASTPTTTHTAPTRYAR